jgi:hypothetical protein
MGLEAATFIHQLNPANPVGAVDPKAQGDDHIRMLKATIQATFAGITGAVTVTHTILNQWAGLAAAYNWSGQHRHIDGTVGAPAFSFVNDTDTGVYRQGANDMRLVSGGVARLIITDTGNYSRVTIGLADGGAGAPSLSFENDADTGLFRFAADSIGFTAAGGVRATLSSVAMNCNVQALFADGSNATPGYSFANDPDTGMYRSGTNEVSLAAGGTAALTIQAGLIQQNAGVFRFQDGAVGAPAITFASDTDTGIYKSASDTLSVTCGGVHTLQMSNGRCWAGDGSLALPGWSFIADTDTGFYRLASGRIGMALDGVAYEVGYKNVPRSTTVTTLALSDVGKCVAVSAAINIPASVFSAGDCLSIYNDSAASVNITTSAGTLRLAGTTTTGTRSLAARGMATLWFNVGGATPEVIASGPGVA